MSFSKKTIALLVSTVVVIAGAITLIGYRNSSTTQTSQQTDVLGNSNTQLKDETVGISLAVDSSFKQAVLSEQDKRDNFIFRLTSANPPILVSVRSETGLRSLALTTKQETLNLVTENAKRSLPDRFPEYIEQSIDNLVVDEKKATQIVYNYTGPSGQRVAQSLLIIEKDSDTVVYVSFQSQANSFDQLTEKFQTPLIDSIRIE